jgi:hypothetical protein
MRPFIPETKVIVDGVAKAMQKVLFGIPLNDEDKAFLKAVEIEHAD